MARRLVAAAMWTLALAGCQSAYMLELDVSNDSSVAATVEIMAGVESDSASDPFVHFTEVIEPGAQRDLAMERPGPDDWTVIVNGEAVTDSDQWPGDSPTIDLSIEIATDGSVAVLDT